MEVDRLKCPECDSKNVSMGVDGEPNICHKGHKFKSEGVQPVLDEANFHRMRGAVHRPGIKAPTDEYAPGDYDKLSRGKIKPPRKPVATSTPEKPAVGSESGLFADYKSLLKSKQGGVSETVTHSVMFKSPEVLVTLNQKPKSAFEKKLMEQLGLEDAPEMLTESKVVNESLIVDMWKFLLDRYDIKPNEQSLKDHPLVKFSVAFKRNMNDMAKKADDILQDDPQAAKGIKELLAATNKQGVEIIGRSAIKALDKMKASLQAEQPTTPTTPTTPNTGIPQNMAGEL